MAGRERKVPPSSQQSVLEPLGKSGSVLFCCGLLCVFQKLSWMTVRFSEGVDLQETEREEILWPGNPEAWVLGTTHHRTQPVK